MNDPSVTLINGGNPYLSDIGQLWEENLFQDIAISCKDQVLQCHQSVLAACSGFLNRVMTDVGNSSDLESIRIILPDFSAEEMSSVLKLVYGYPPSVSENNFPFLLAFALGLNFVREVPLLSQVHQVTEPVKKEKSEIYRLVEGDKDVRIEEAPDNAFDDFVEPIPSSSSTSPPIPSSPQHHINEVSKKGRRKRYQQIQEHQWKCLTCNETRQSRPEIVRHFENVHLAEIGKQNRSEKYLVQLKDGWECKNCRFFADQKFRLQNHLCLVGKCDLEFEYDSFHCGGCTSTFSNQFELLQHLKCCVYNGMEKTFPCTECSEICYDLDSRSFHHMLHENKYPCQYCDRSYQTAESFLRHWTVAHSRAKGDYTCPQCDKKFDYKKNLANHLKFHDNPKVFACKKCDRSFTSKSSLIYHMQTHTASLLTCPTCQKTFKSSRGFRYHQSMHEGVTDYLCDDCGSGFVTRQKLMYHRRLKHTFERPFACDLCSQSFIRSDKLIVHKRRAHTGEKPFKCPDCDWRGVDTSALIHHRKKHLNKNRASQIK